MKVTKNETNIYITIGERRMIESVTISYEEFKSLTKSQEKLERVKRECRNHNKQLSLITLMISEDKDIQELMDKLTLLNAQTIGNIKIIVR